MHECDLKIQNILFKMPCRDSRRVSVVIETSQLHQKRTIAACCVLSVDETEIREYLVSCTFEFEINSTDDRTLFFSHFIQLCAAAHSINVISHVGYVVMFNSEYNIFSTSTSSLSSLSLLPSSVPECTHKIGTFLTQTCAHSLRAS